MGMTFDEALDHLYTYSNTLGSRQTTLQERKMILCDNGKVEIMGEDR